MSKTAFYISLCKSMDDDAPRRVLGVLVSHIGRTNAISIDALAAKTRLHERQVRDAIETLRTDYHIPVMSESGKSGRWIAETRNEIAECIAELQARVDSTRRVIDGLRAATLPVDERLEKTVQQPGLF